ncbi:MAG: hypothetical protein U9R37_02050 [Campylobacterota bacterium]|nr:hypothetical protein [Campylobacterota bacterium]
MIGSLVKLGFLVVVVLVALNIFAPDQADKVLSAVSEKTDIDKDKLQDNLNNATEFAKDTAKEVKENIDK